MKFRRQQPLGPYVVDFFCEAAALIVEADGGVHFERQAQDRERDRVLTAGGLLVLRVSNEDILERTGDVLARIRAVALGRVWTGEG